MTTAANMDVVVTYSLSEDNKITVQISATSAGNTETMVDMCSSMFFQLMTGTVINIYCSFFIFYHLL